MGFLSDIGDAVSDFFGGGGGLNKLTLGLGVLPCAHINIGGDATWLPTIGISTLSFHWYDEINPSCYFACGKTCKGGCLNDRGDLTSDSNEKSNLSTEMKANETTKDIAGVTRRLNTRSGNSNASSCTQTCKASCSVWCSLNCKTSCMIDNNCNYWASATSVRATQQQSTNNEDKVASTIISKTSNIADCSWCKYSATIFPFF